MDKRLKKDYDEFNNEWWKILLWLAGIALVIYFTIVINK